MISEFPKVRRVAFLETAIRKAQLPGMSIPGFHEILRDIDSQYFRVELGRRNCGRAITASEVQDHGSVLDSDSSDECLAALAHACGDAGKVTLFPEGLIGIGRTG